MVSFATLLVASVALAAIAATGHVEDVSALLQDGVTLSSAQRLGEPEQEAEEEGAVKVGDVLFHNKIKSKVIWDGRATGHDFLKVKLLEGMKAGQTKMVTLEELSSSDPVVEKQEAQADKLKEKAVARARKHAPPSASSVRRRRAEDEKAYRARLQNLPGAYTPDQL
uniref:Peptidylprolyl isomerase n=1 Tax=Alexandrium catenella TaxID=2925 RepID=A0A7S1QJP3_ALECA